MAAGGQLARSLRRRHLDWRLQVGARGVALTSALAKPDGRLERLWLEVPFEEKNEAKRIGGRWDNDERRWYAPLPIPELLERYERVYLAQPREENRAVKASGGRWDLDRQMWYTHRGNEELLAKWGVAYLCLPPEPQEAQRMGASFDWSRRMWFTHRSSHLLEKWAVAHLNVPLDDKDEAKSLGAQWDNDRRLWYTFTANEELLQRWPLKPVEIRNEDRAFGGNALFVDLIPSTCFFTNVRSCVERSDWDRLRTHIYERARQRCECCGVDCKASTTTRMEAHERWSFEEGPGSRRRQRLVRLVALCRECHQATHMQLSDVSGWGEASRLHLRKVTGMTEEECEQHIAQAYALAEARSDGPWDLDLGLIKDSGIAVVQIPDKEQRLLDAQQGLAQRREREARAEGSSFTFRL